MSLSADAGRVPRFDLVERLVHWITAVLVLVCLGTAAALYMGPVSTLVGRRALMRDLHVGAGLLLPVPYLLARIGPWSVRLRDDVRRLARWDEDDLRWLKTAGRDPWARPGKFHPGQKLNAAFVAGALPVMLGTGSIMRWFDPFPLSWRTGATFVHDTLALALFVVVVGHIGKALATPAALTGMWRGSVDARWAVHRHPRWADTAGDESQTPRGSLAGSQPSRSTAMRKA